MRWFISNASFSLYGRVGRADLYSSTRRHYRNASDVSACFVFVSNNTILFSSYDFFFFFFFFFHFLLFFFILRLFFPHFRCSFVLFCFDFKWRERTREQQDLVLSPGWRYNSLYISMSISLVLSSLAGWCLSAGLWRCVRVSVCPHRITNHTPSSLSLSLSLSFFHPSTSPNWRVVST